MSGADFTWHDAPPSVEECLALRSAASLSPFAADAAARGLAGTWQAACVRTAGRVVGMGRVVGDGGCFLQIVDIAVDPAYQRRGLGRAIKQRLVEAIARRAPDGVSVSLLADPPGVRLYESFGFRASAPASVGMFRRFVQVPGEHP